jgi:hypothetical protein
MIAVGYVCLGILVGLLSGLSGSPIASALLAALFTFAGGTAAYFIDKPQVAQRLLGTIIAAFASACVLGLLAGIVVKENRLLTTAARKATQTVETDYLKSATVSEINTINLQYVNKEIEAPEAYRRLREALLASGSLSAR